MERKLTNLDDISAFKLIDDEQERLYDLQDECSVSWTNSAGWPVSMPHSYVRVDGKFWIHTTVNRQRVKAFRARPQTCVTVSGIGTEMYGCMVTNKTLATVHDGDRDLVRWLLPLFLRRVGKAADDESLNQQMLLLDTPNRVVIEFDPVESFSYNSQALRKAIGENGYDRWQQ